MKIVNVFFSQPMSGLTIDEIKTYRQRMINETFTFLTEELGYSKELIINDVNRFFDEKKPEDAPDSRLWYLGRSIQAMAEADYIAFARDWASASGCLVEETAARNYFLYRIYGRDYKGCISEHIDYIFCGNNSKCVNV